MNPGSVIRQLDFDSQFESPAWRQAAVAVCDESGIRFERLERAASSDHVVFLVDDRLVVKLFRPTRNCFQRELKALAFAAGGMAVRTPEIVSTGNIEGIDYMITTRVPGRAFTRPEFLNLSRSEQVALLSELADGLRRLHQMNPAPFEDDWHAFVNERAETFIERQMARGVNDKIIAALPAYLEANLPLVPFSPTCFMHADVHFGNLRLIRENGGIRISGLFDFADSRRGHHEYEFLAIGVLMVQGERDLQREFFRTYGYREADLDEEMRRRLMTLTMLYETSDLRRYALRLHPDAVHLTLDELERAIWCFV